MCVRQTMYVCFEMLLLLLRVFRIEISLISGERYLAVNDELLAIRQMNEVVGAFLISLLISKRLLAFKMNACLQDLPARTTALTAILPSLPVFWSLP